jgi:hypothetical protein
MGRTRPFLFGLVVLCWNHFLQMRADQAGPQISAEDLPLLVAAPTKTIYTYCC